MRFFKKNSRCFIVAEVSANHAQDIKKAISMIRQAKRCGADAVKFQAYTPDTLTIDSNNRYFKIRHTKWKGQTLYKLYAKAATPWSWFKELKKVADSEGIIFFASAFDKKSVDLLEELDVPIHKITSFEIIDQPLIEYVAKTRKPLILSTGMATLREIKEALSAAKATKEVALLKCVSSYPASAEDMHLRTIEDMHSRFKVPIGISDHSLGTAVSVAAVALGAKIVEKHFTLSSRSKTPDSFFSITPDELKRLVADIRITEDALGKVSYGKNPNENINRIFRRSLFAVKDILKGELITESNVRSIRPSHGLKPEHYKKALGGRAKKKIKKGTPLSWNLME